MANLFKSHFGPPCPCSNLKPCCVAAIYNQSDQVCPSASQPTVPSQSSHGQPQDDSHEGHEGHEGHEAAQRQDGSHEGHEGHEGHEVHEGQQHQRQKQDYESHEGQGHEPGQACHGPMGHQVPEARLHQLGVAVEAMHLPMAMPTVQASMVCQPAPWTACQDAQQGWVQGQDQLSQEAPQCWSLFLKPKWPTTTGHDAHHMQPREKSVNCSHQRPFMATPCLAELPVCSMMKANAMYGRPTQMPYMANLLKCHDCQFK